MRVSFVRIIIHAEKEENTKSAKKKGTKQNYKCVHARMRVVTVVHSLRSTSIKQDRPIIYNYIFIVSS